MFTSLINLFYPRICAGCESFLLQDEKVICTRCRHEIPLTNHLVIPNNEAFMKFYGKIPVEFAVAHFYFHKKGVVAEWIHKLKYKGHEEIGEAIGVWLAEELKNFAPLQDVGANHSSFASKKIAGTRLQSSDQFWKGLSEKLKIPYENVLIRNLYTKTQTREKLTWANRIG